MVSLELSTPVVSKMYRVKRKRHIRVGEEGERTVFEPGDEIEPTDAELESFSDRFEEVQTVEVSSSSTSEGDSTEDSDESGEDQSDASESTREYPDLSEMSVNEELPEYLQENDFSQAEKNELHDLESSGKDRITAHQRIDEYA